MRKPSTGIEFCFDHSYGRQLPDFCVSCDPAVFPDPQLLRFNSVLAEELGLDAEFDSSLVARIFSGNELPVDAHPIAQAYAGHQFGNFVPQLGDGRALLLGEVIDRNGQRRDIAFKGSGPTLFARGGDGKAAVGPVLREYLIGEAMHALGIPTTRALAAVATGETVYRTTPLPGAVLTRVAASHIRVGTFEFFAARRQFDQVRKLADYVIQRHYPELAEEEDRYLSLINSVADRQAALLARWMLVGFIHGVMNTDNMAISGETIDYGPCAFMESYDPATVFSSIDHGGRYAYGNQPIIARWNLARFAETLLPVIDPDSPERVVGQAMEIINDFIPRYEAHWLRGMRAKLGLPEKSDDDNEDRILVEQWLDLLQHHEVDFTLAWRRLTDAAEGNHGLLESLFASPDVLQPWLERWHQRITQPGKKTAEAMRTVNPIYIPRNHLVEEALEAASDQGDLSSFEKLLGVIEHPFNERPDHEHYSTPAPRQFTSCYKTFCGT